MDIVSITLTFVILGTTLSFLIWRTPREANLSRLRALYLQLDMIKDSAEGSLKEYKPNTQLPSYVGTIDVDYYLTRLPSKIRREWGMGNIYLSDLKINLLETKNKIENINHSLSRLIESLISGHNELFKALQKELFDNTYYADLKDLASEVQHEIEKILLPRQK